LVSKFRYRDFDPIQNRILITLVGLKDGALWQATRGGHQRITDFRFDLLADR
jgi:hypothetical protein